MSTKLISIIVAVVLLLAAAAYLFSGGSSTDSERTSSEKPVAKSLVKDHLTIPGVITARIIDQHGVSPLPVWRGDRLSYGIFDTLGELVDTGNKRWLDITDMYEYDDERSGTLEEWIADKSPNLLFQPFGRLIHAADADYIVSKPLKPGTYTLRIPYRYDHTYGYDGEKEFDCLCHPTEVTVEVTDDGVWLGDVRVVRLAQVGIDVQNEAGTTLGDKSSIQLLEYTFTDGTPTDWVDELNFGYGMFSRPTIPAYPPGTYTVRASAGGYETKEHTFTVEDEDMEVAIVLTKTP